MGLLDGALSGLLGSDNTATQNKAGFPGLTFSLPGITFPGIGTGTNTGLPSSASQTSLNTTSSSSSSTTTSSSSSSTTTSADQSSSSSSTTTQTSTQFVVVNGQATATSGAGHTQSFLENKALSGAVFGIVGLIALILVFVIATWFLRRRKRSRLLDDALSFDPSLLAAADRADAVEKGHASNSSLSSAGHQAGYGTTYGAPQQQHAQFYPNHPADYYGQQQQMDYYAPPTNYAYAAPMSDASHSTNWTAPAPVPVPTPKPQQNIPRVPVPPTAGPLPEEFGSSEKRESVEEAEFRARTLKVVNE